MATSAATVARLKPACGCLLICLLNHTWAPPAINSSSNPRHAGSGTGPARPMEVIRRFKHAEQLVSRMQAIGKHEMYTMTQCTDNYSLGVRNTAGQV